MTTRRFAKLSGLQTADEGVVLIPFAAVINGTTDPDGLSGDGLVSFTRVSAGKFKGQLRDRPAVCFFADADLGSTSDSADFVTRVDPANVTVDGTFIVHTLTGGTGTDPADNTPFGGFLFAKKTTRKARAPT